MNNKNKDFFISDVDVNVGEEEITLAPPTELIEEAKEIAQNTKFDEKFPFALQYNANQKEFLLSMIKTAGAIVEDDDEEGHVLATMMNMTQLAFIKQLDCVERVKTDEGTNPFLAKEAIDLAQIKQEQQKDAIVDGETQKIVTDINSRILNVQSATLAETEQVNDDVAVASVGVSARCSCNNQPTNTDWDSARDITIETWVSGSLCCPGVKQWFKFTVPETKEYTIYTTGSMDTEGELYDHNHNRIDDETTNIKINGRLNLRIRCVLYVGVTYYICVSDAKDNTGSYTLKVTSQILAEKVDVLSNRSDGIVVLERGKTYQLPRGEGYDFLNITGVENAPLSVKVNPNTTADKRVYWSASFIPTDHVDVAFNSYGDNEVYQTITAHTCGGTTLYAWDWFERGKRGQVYVVVVPNISTFVKATSFEICKDGTNEEISSLDMNVGDYQKIVAKIFPSTATVQNVNWVSTNPEVATISPYGKIEAISRGTTTIRAKPMDGGSAFTELELKVWGCYYISSKIDSNKVIGYRNKLDGILTGNRGDVCLRGFTQSVEQIWCISDIEENVDSQVKAYLDNKYGFNAYRSSSGSFNCDLIEVDGNQDANVRFEKQDDGYCKIRLNNGQDYGYYLTLVGNNIKWESGNNSDQQLWKLNEVDWDQYKSGQIEYHLIPQTLTNYALYADKPTPIERLNSDEYIRLEEFSYMNRQRWLIKKIGNSKRLYNQYGDDFVLCKMGEKSVCVSNNTNNECDLIITYCSAPNLVEIKLAESNLYLTVSGTDVTWEPYNSSNNSSQRWELRSFPSDCYSGCDTTEQLTEPTVKALKNGGEKFVFRYYKPITVNEVKIQTFVKDGTEEDHENILYDTIKELGLIGVDISSEITCEEDIDTCISVPALVDYINNLSTDDVVFHHEWAFLASERKLLKDYQLKIVTGYQDEGTIIQFFDPRHAQIDAFCALTCAKILGQPQNTVIYFCVDELFYRESHLDTIDLYFKIVKRIVNYAGYKVGIYGGDRACKKVITQKNKINGIESDIPVFIAQAGDAWDNEPDVVAAAEIRQGDYFLYNNVIFDRNVALKQNYGFWEENS